MEPPSWDRIQEIYYSALPTPQSERSAFVTTACGSDPFLVGEVNSLLAADESAGDFLESPVFEIGLRIITSKNANNSTGPNASPVDELIGKMIDQRYLVEKELGHGGIGAVYLARDLRLHNRPVVIKVLLQASLQDSYVVKKFRQEVEALARIEHPGVVSVLGAGELADGKPYIVMQYVSGVTLRSRISSEGMNLERAALILKQIGAALDDVHEKGIFHRDLKPDNIMLQVLKGGTELVKVVDFGIAKVKDSVVAPSTVNEAPVGTVLYMSPEQLRGGEKITVASDIYSMALIAYEMVTGRRPFNPTSAPQLLEMHRAGVRVKPIDLRAGLSTEAQAIILRALSFERKDRYQSAAEFGDSLARALMNDGEIVELTGQDARNRLPTEPAKLADLGPPAETILASPPIVTKSGPTSLNPIASDHRRSRLSSTRLKVVGGFVFILVCIAAAVFAVYIFRGRNEARLAATPQRSFNYWLTVQKMRDGKRYQDPFQSSGQEIFENGYKFRLNFSSPDPGYLYVFNEGLPERDGTSLTIIYPTRSKSSGLGADQSVQTNWNTFRGQAGTENFWIVWSASPVSQLEAAKTEALENPKGALTDSLSTVKEFLGKHYEAELKTTKDTATKITNVRGTGDVLVKLAKLEHR